MSQYIMRAYLNGYVYDEMIAEILKRKLKCDVEYVDVAYSDTFEYDLDYLKQENPNKQFRHFGENKHYFSCMSAIEFFHPNGNKRFIGYDMSNFCVVGEEKNKCKSKADLEKIESKCRTYIEYSAPDGYFGGEKYETSIKILKAIVEEFGGWIDECPDDKNTKFYYVRKKVKTLFD